MNTRKISLALFFFFVLLSGFVTAQTPESRIRVAIYQDKGVGKGAGNMLARIIEKDPAFEYRIINGQDIRDGVLDQFDLFLLPGGSGRGEAASMQPEGVEKVKAFVRSGHGYLGICAGAYFPLQQEFINVTRKSTLWERGHAKLKIELTDLGREVFGQEYVGELEVNYHNGPVININENPNMPKVEVLAWFRSEVAENGTPAGIQVNSPAIIFTRYEKGPVITISPHPEGTQGLKGFINSALHYLAEHSEK